MRGAIRLFTVPTGRHDYLHSPLKYHCTNGYKACSGIYRSDLKVIVAVVKDSNDADLELGVIYPR